MRTGIISAIRMAVLAAACAPMGATALAQGPRLEARPGEQPGRGRIDSADRLIFWVGAGEVAKLSDSQLDLWKSRGVDGFICMTRHLPEMGGTDRLSGDPEAHLGAKGFERQRAFRDSKVVLRAKERGMKMYLGFWLVNYYNAATPLKDWFDDPGWADAVIPRVRDVAGAAKLLGFDGIAFDQELYGQAKGATATWAWDYPGNTHPEAEVRAKAKQRGRELMRTILGGFPDVEIVVYHYQFPETWEGVVQERVNHIHEVGAPLLFLDFWDGLSSVEGYKAIRFINALFYKVPHLGTWETALQHELNSFHSLLSRRLSRWDYASTRIFESPFSWINGNVAGEGAFTAPRPPGYVAAQLGAFKKWGMGGEFANFAYGGLGGFDYTPYAGAMRSASTSSVVDSQPPLLELTSPAPDREMPHETTKEAFDLDGFAVDNLAIRAVRWKNNRGGAGAAKMTWRVKSGDYTSGYDWQMDWSARGITLQPGINEVEVTAEDIKGLTSSKTLTVRRK